MCWSNGRLGEGIHNPVQSCVVLRKSGGNVIVKLWPQLYRLRESIAGEVEEMEKLKNLSKLG